MGVCSDYFKIEHLTCKLLQILFFIRLLTSGERCLRYRYKNSSCCADKYKSALCNLNNFSGKNRSVLFCLNECVPILVSVYALL